jgi:hypothetical protein
LDVRYIGHGGNVELRWSRWFQLFARDTSTDQPNNINQTLKIWLNGVHFPFAFSPSSTRRRMASERETSWEAAQASRLATVAGSSRAGIVSLYFVPGGRPNLFLCTVFCCFAISICVHERQAEGKLAASAPALTPTTKEANPMAKANSVLSTPRRTAPKIQTKKRAKEKRPAPGADAKLTAAYAELAALDDALEALYKKYGEDRETRDDFLSMEARRYDLLEMLGSMPSRSQAGIDAKAAALLMKEATLDDQRFQEIAESLAQDILHRGDVGGKVTAIADKFGKLLSKYFDAHLVWARLARKARAVVDAKFPDDDRVGGKTPACRLLFKTLRKNGCNAAQARLSVIFKQMTALAKVIEKDKSQSAAVLRAKCLVALWEAIPGSADNEGSLTFDDEYPANLLFRATAAFTGLSPMVEAIEARLGEEA